MTKKEVREKTAANAVAAHLGAVLRVGFSVRKWDDGSADRMHDFYVEGLDHKIALEVTTIANGQRVGRDVRWERAAPGGWVKVGGLKGCWLAYHEGDSEAADVVETIRTYVPQLEALGVAQIDARAWQEHVCTPEELRPLHYEPLRALNMAGVLQMSCVVDASDALMAEHGGKVQVLRGFGADRPADRNLPVALIDKELREADLHRSDVEKLIAVKDATARHLWLWIEPAEGLTIIRSFETEGLPDVDLEVEGIDGVWLGRSPAKNVVAGYRWLRGLGWSVFSGERNEAAPD